MLNLMRKHVLTVLLGVLFVSQPGVAKASGGPKDSTLTLHFVGDMLLDRGVRVAIRRWGLPHLLSTVAPILRSGDAAIGNLECPLTLHPAPLAKKYIFRGDPEAARVLRVSGFTHLSLANNHSHDQGRDGILATMDALREQGILPIGAGTSQVDACQPTLYTVRGRTIAVFATVDLLLEQWMYRDSLPGPCQSPARDLASAIRAWKKDHPDHVIILFPHWGREAITEPSPELLQAARACVDAGADAVLGHHPHVVSGIEWYRRRPIMFSLGNFLFDRYHPPFDLTVIVTLRISPSSPPSVELHPLRITREGPRPLRGASLDSAVTYLRRLSPTAKLSRSSASSPVGSLHCVPAPSVLP